MRIFNIATIATLAFAVSANVYSQEYLPSEKTMIRLDVGQATADGLWIKKTFTDYEQNNKTKVKSRRYGLTWLRGFGDGYTIKIKGAYIKSESSKPLVGTDGKVAGLADVGVSVTRKIDISSLPNFGVNFFTGFRVPGNQEKSGAQFLAISDGKSKYDLGTSLSYSIGNLIPSLTSVYTIRQGGKTKNQFENTFTLGYILSNSFYASVMYNNFQTLGGLGIGDTGFAFGQLNEDHSGIGATLQYNISSAWSSDVTFYSRQKGINTDRNKAINLGLSYLF